MKVKKKHKTWIIVALGVTVLAAAIILLVPQSQTGPQKPAKLKPAFLDVQSPWVDSLMSTMTVEQKVAQIIFARSDINQKDSLLTKTKWGGFFFYGRWDGIQTPDSLLEGIPPLMASMHKFETWMGETQVPSREYLSAIPDTLIEQLTFLDYHLGRVAGFSGEVFSVDSLRLNSAPYDYYYSHPHRPKLFSWAWLEGDLSPAEDESEYMDSVLKPLAQLGPMGIPGTLVNSDKIAEKFGKRELDLSEFLAERCDFRGVTGVILDEGSSSQDVQQALNAGCDILISPDPHHIYSTIRSLMVTGAIDKDVLDGRVKRVLQAKAWLGMDTVRMQRDTLEIHEWVFDEWAKKAITQSVTVGKNQMNRLPIVDSIIDQRNFLLIRKGEVSVPHIYEELTRLNTTSARRIDTSLGNTSGYSQVIVVINDTLLEKDSAFISNLEEVDKTGRLTVVTLGPREQLQFVEGLSTVIHAYGMSKLEQESIAEIITGGRKSSDGKVQQIRLTDARPEEVNMSSDTLKKIQWIAMEGINNGAYPGCQVLVARKGKIIYNRAFGHQTYARKIPVTKEHLFDMASVTKITGTTLAAMKLNEMGVFGLEDSLKDYLPDTLQKHLPFNRPSTLRNVKWSELMIHKSGLPAGYPVFEFMNYKDSTTGRFDRFFCDQPDDTIYTVQIAENMYMDRTYLDSIWVRINSMWLDPNKGYKYSDVNFNVLYTMLKAELEKRPSLVKRDPLVDTGRYDAFRKFLRQTFYDPLRMDRTYYRPKEKFPLNRICPTEDDKFWRKQLVHGHVHDPTAALYGGVAGNAGLFTSAESVAKLYQMWLNRGTYGGKRYLQPQTINRFTQRQINSHRGLGFNKPVGGGMYGIPAEVPVSTYGHTGWTGNSVWIDPENEIIYIFLSNRSHPVSDNPKIIHMGIRKRIHEVVYQAILDDTIPWRRPIDD